MDNNSVVIISDDDDEYVSFTWSPPPPVIGYCCYFCRHLNFPTEQDVDLHIKKNHPSIFQQYSFRSRKCRLCRRVFRRSLSFLGLISHIAERKCKDKIDRLVVHWAGQENVIYADYRGIAHYEQQNKVNSSFNDQSMHVKSNSRTPEVCSSFLCKNLDKNVAHPCESCQLQTKASEACRPPKSAQVINPVPLNARNGKSMHHHHHHRKLRALNAEDAKQVNELYLKAISAQRSSAIQANRKNCKRTFRHMRKKLRKRQKEPNQGNEDGYRFGRFVLRFKKDLWDQVKKERQMSTVYNFDTD